MLKSCCRVVEFISGKAALTAEATASPQTPDPYVPGCRLPEIGIHLRCFGTKYIDQKSCIN